MTSHILGVLAANLALLPAGVGFLLLIDAWRRMGRWSRFAVALLAGHASFIIVAPPLLYAGLSVSPVIVVPLAWVLLLAGLYVARRRSQGQPSGDGDAQPPAPLAAAIVAVPLIALAVGAVGKPLYQIDTILNWVMKAKVIWAGGERLTGVLDPQLFARPDLHPQSHLEYPLGMNAFFAWSFHWMGDADIRVMHLDLVLLVAAAVGTSWAILRPVVPDLPLAVGLGGVTLMPAAVHQLLTAYADIPLAFVWAVGALALIRWAAEGERYLLALATLLFAATLALKQDGVFYDVAIYLGIGAFVFRRRQPVVELLVSAGVVAVTAIPWQLYTTVHDLTRRDIRPGLHRMQAQTDRLLPTLEGMVDVVAHPRTTLMAVPLALGLALVCILRRRSCQALPFLVSTSTALLAILFIYWNSAVTLHAILIPALGRIMMGLIILAWLLVPALAFAAIASPDEYDRTRLRGARRGGVRGVGR
jgi:hypothetical protein